MQPPRPLVPVTQAMDEATRGAVSAGTEVVEMDFGEFDFAGSATPDELRPHSASRASTRISRSRNRRWSPLPVSGGARPESLWRPVVVEERNPRGRSLTRDRCTGSRRGGLARAAAGRWPLTGRSQFRVPPRPKRDDQTKVIGELRLSIPLYNVYLNEADEVVAAPAGGGQRVGVGTATSIAGFIGALAHSWREVLPR